LRTRDPKAARQAMHGHLAQAIDDLLRLAESDALEQTREKMAEQRRMLGLRSDI
jgi:GntR family transcriptional regulator, hexuronate regulon transcriptional repressor